MRRAIQRFESANRVTSCDPFFAMPLYRAFTWLNCRLMTRNGCSTYARTEALARSTTASGDPGASNRRRPGGMATIQATPGVSHQRATPRYPESAWTTISRPCSRDPATARSCTLAGVATTVWTRPEFRVDPDVRLHAEEPLVPLPGLVPDGGRMPVRFFVEPGARVMVN